MSDNKQAVSIRGRVRPNLGLLTDQIAGASAWWLGAVGLARERDANLFIFRSGQVWDQSNGIDILSSIMHSLIGMESLDGLVLVQWWPTFQIFESSYERFYSPLPVVNLHRHYEGFPGTIVDNHESIVAEVRHLVEVHGYRRLAFIGGSAENPSANARYRAYVTVLAEYGIPLDANLVTYGNFSSQSGIDAIRVLLDERQLRPTIDFEAVIATNDNMALAALEEMQRRGIRVPFDVAVVGFDDIDTSRFEMPPLTTVRMPFYEMGRQAAEMVLAKVQGEPFVEHATVPGQLVVRQSCGCFLSPSVDVGAVALPQTRAERRASVAADQRALAIAELVQVAGSAAEALAPGWAEQLVDTFFMDMQSEVESLTSSSSRFMAAFYETLRQLHVNGYDLLDLGRALLFAMRRRMRTSLDDNERMRRAESLWQQAMIFVADVAQQAQASQAYHSAGHLEQLRAIGEELITTFDLSQLLDLMARELPRLGIPSCYLSLYVDPDISLDTTRLMLAYTEQGRVALDTNGVLFRARELAPAGLLPQDRNYVMIVEPLYFQETCLGFAFFEVGPEQGEVYETLARQISSALMGALLVQQQEQAQREADAARQQAQAALSDVLTTRAITDRIRRAADTEAVLRITLEELSQVLGASLSVARLGTREQLLQIGVAASASVNE